MTIDLTPEERDMLLDILRDRLGTLREEIHHSMVSTFTDELKQREKALRSLVLRLEPETATR